jgi:hypothetical protein
MVEKLAIFRQNLNKLKFFLLNLIALWVAAQFSAGTEALSSLLNVTWYFCSLRSRQLLACQPEGQRPPMVATAFFFCVIGVCLNMANFQTMVHRDAPSSMTSRSQFPKNWTFESLPSPFDPLPFLTLDRHPYVCHSLFVESVFGIVSPFPVQLYCD